MTTRHSAEELAEEAQEEGGFIHRVLSGSLIPVQGDIDDLRRSAPSAFEGLNQPATAPPTEELTPRG